MIQLCASIRSAAMKDLVPVRTLGDLEWFVKESELLTGNAGRRFVVAGADRPAYRVQSDPAGFQISRLDEDIGGDPMLATAPELVGHTLGNALACGLLYTEPLPQ